MVETLEAKQPASADVHFSRWRPSYHFIGPQGWLNDPCAPGYDPVSGLYHLAFQWNPKSAVWGEIVWGKATSRDLIIWEISPEPCLVRDAPYDHEAVFTGCFHPTALDGKKDGTLTVFYTSVSHLPIHYTLPYHFGSESLSVAESKDGGKTWTKSPRNPILPGPPKDGPLVTGWRDPYVASWPRMSKALGQVQGKETLFGIMSGGIVNKTPTSLLYAIDPHDLTQWQYIAPLIAVGLNYAPSRWTGDLGVNWEVTNFLTLSDGKGAEQEFLVFGAEGCKTNVPKPPRVNRAQLWAATNIKSGRIASGALLEHTYGGVLDYGLYYAANGFWDPVTQQQVVYGWVTEDDLPVDLQIRQNWSGCLSVPRVLSLATIPNVIRARKSNFSDITSIQTEAVSTNGVQTYTVHTLAIKPDSRLSKLRAAAKDTEFPSTKLSALENGIHSIHLPLQTSKWEAIAEYEVGSSCDKVGLAIVHSTDPLIRTLLTFHPASETFTISRPPITAPEHDTATSPSPLPDESAPHTLFTTRPGTTSEEVEERLRIHAFYDGSLLEVFVNERTAITTRVYLPDQTCRGLLLFAESRERDGEMLGECRVWDGLSVA